MVQDMSIRYMRYVADAYWQKLSEKEKKTIRSNPRKQVGQFCKYGYTQHSLWLTDDGRLIYCEGYKEYCEIITQYR